MPVGGGAHRQLGLGLVVVGVGIATLVRADLGLGPWDVLHQGLSRRTGIPMGTVGILVGIPIVALWWPLRQRPGVGTVANLVLVGVTIDIALAVMPAAGDVRVQAGLLCLGTLLVALGSGLYLGVGLGPGPRDGLMTGLHRRLGWSVRLARTLIELAALGLGILLGGTAGVGTIVFALAIGPLVQVALGRFGVVGPPEEVGTTPADAVGLTAE